jgi:hypothetical protein
MCGSQKTVDVAKQAILGNITITTVGWGCQDCGHEWGFEPTREVYEILNAIIRYKELEERAIRAREVKAD